MIRLIITLCIFACAAPLLAGTDSERGELGDLPFDRAIRIGSGRQVVVEVSDPDCRFSRRMNRYWNMREDVTRYVFLLALKNHPEAEQKARYILCARDRAAAYQEVFTGGLDFDEKPLDRECDDHGLLKSHGEVAARLKVIGTPTYFIGGSRINGAKLGEIEDLLGGKKIPFDVDPE